MEWKRFLCGHMHEQVNDAVRVAPLIVIPRHEFEEALLSWQVVLKDGFGIIDCLERAMNEILGDKLFVSIRKEALHVRSRGVLQEFIDLLDGRVFLRCEREIHN